MISAASATSSTSTSSPLDPELEVFTTGRVVRSSPDSFTIPLLTLHGRRLENALRTLAPSEIVTSTPAVWEERITQAVKREMKPLAEGVSWTDQDQRLKCSVRLSDGSLRLELFHPIPRLPGVPYGFAPSVVTLTSPPHPSRPKVVLSPRALDPSQVEFKFLLNKTSNRKLYDEHQALAAPLCPGAQSTILHFRRSDHAPPDEGPDDVSFITETTIANLLFLPPAGDAEGDTWLTPRSTEQTPFLPGLQRSHLLGAGEIREADISVAQAKRWTRDGGRIACCNALRGVWEVQVVWG